MRYTESFPHRWQVLHVLVDPSTK
jgi:hypothetical protein